MKRLLVYVPRKKRREEEDGDGVVVTVETVNLTKDHSVLGRE